MLGLSKEEERLLRRLNTPQKIQDYLDTLPFNFEKTGETLRSPRETLRAGRAHCFEGALLAAAALWYNGREPLLLDLVPLRPKDDAHVVALFKERGYWGAISKTNHGVLRFRDPIYKTLRELVLSYFHEYFLNTTGEKTLRFYSRPFNLKRLGEEWVTSAAPLWELDQALEKAKHYSLLPRKGVALRPASRVEREVGTIVEY